MDSMVSSSISRVGSAGWTEVQSGQRERGQSVFSQLKGIPALLKLSSPASAADTVEVAKKRF